MQAVFLELIKLSLIGSLFAGAVMLVRLIFPKTPRRIFCLLWGVVALRLICPLSIESSLSLVPDRIASGQIIASVGNEYIGDVDIIRENDAAYDSAVEAGRQPVYSEDGYYVVTEKDSLEIPKTVGETLYPVLSWIWAVGTVSMLIYTVVSFLVLRRKMAEATRLRDNIWQCERVDSPFVLGFIKPRIYLPYAITDSDMANVIAHEQAHIHRRDHWWKPIGFILLSLHWFNPVLWLAYVMLCRDIEAACDEKVIKHMEKDEMRAYSTALLNCSVNRRRIAACPLAFGEVGVKERVKTVMNYKKPAFWIVIAAVALCIVVAVCFLTDPKEAKPDVSLLEFPGLKWGMTPEEVKAALDISEDMILEEARIASNGEFRLTVSGSKYFGADAEAIMFRFYEYGEKTVLWNVNVHYAAGTDMTVVRDNLIEIYGPGTDYGFTNYELHRSPGETDYTVQSYIDWNFLPIDSSLRSIEYGTSIEENAKHPNPPDELVHRWASRVKGSSVIPSDDLEKLIEMFGDDVGTYADRATALEYLDKKVPITILCRDGYTNAAGVEYRPAVAFVAGYLTLCKSVYPEAETAASLSEEGNLSALSIPGIKWLSTPEEVKDALGITGDQIISEKIAPTIPNSNSSDRYQLSATDLILYEREVPYAYFQFRQGPDDAFALERVLVMFAEDTDMEQLKADLAGIYGPGSDEPYSYYMYSNNIKRDQELIPHAEGSLRYLANQDVVLDGVEGNPFRDALEDPEYMTHYWITENGCSVIPKQVAEYYKYLMAQPWNEREIALQDDETLMAMLDQMPWVHMTIGNRHMSTITRDAQGSEEHPYYTNNYMEFNASWLAEYVHKAETYQDSEE